MGIDENFNIDQRDLEHVVNKAKGENDFLFTSKPINVKDAPPRVNRNSFDPAPPKKLVDMNHSEVKDALRRLQMKEAGA